MIVGLALSEAVVFYSIFLLPRDQPQTKMLLVGLSFVSMLQFAPFYAREPERDPFRQP